MFQSTFPQGERRDILLTVSGGHTVSIHVPARGTTLFASFWTAGIVVSIHVPARGTTRLEPAAGEKRLSFNPRSRKGNDEVRLRSFSVHSVSIHVPARGTTCDICLVLQLVGVSIHVPARGTTAKRGLIKWHIIKFQSTFPQGERHGISTIISTLTGFNPRSRKGNDIFFPTDSQSVFVSIHVPARGTTLWRI